MKNFKPVVNFYINTDVRIKSVERRIMIYIRGFGGQTIKLSSPYKVNPKFWDTKKQNFKSNSQAFYDYSDRLIELKQKILNALLKDLSSVNPDYTFQEAKSYIERIFNQKKDVPKTFFEYYEEYLEESKFTMAKATITKLQTLKKHLLAFQTFKMKKEKDYSITFKIIDNQFLREFYAFLVEHLQIANNTNSRYLKAFKTFLKRCTEKGIAIDLSKLDYSIKLQEVELIALTNDELQRIIDLDLSNKPRLERVKDIFLFAVFTGQRFSDVSKIKFSDVVDNTWRLQTQKTKTLNKIPLSKGAIAILEKYKFAKMPSLSNQKCNDYLKEIGKLADISTQLSITRYKGANPYTETYSKYELLTTHTARRTFVTLSLQKGMRVDTLKSITGHKDHRSYERYIKEDEENKKKELQNAWG